MATAETNDLDMTAFARTLRKAQTMLIEARGDRSHWRGRLAPSALSTATAISALSMVLRHSDGASTEELRSAVSKGLAWLDAAQKEDGGFGDTDRSPPNIASSYLALAAWHLGDDPKKREAPIAKLQEYIDAQGGWDALRERYGKDKTFVVPILSNCAVAGLVPWSRVPTLPFEMAAFPQSMYRFLQMPVVSYAVPALVAIGQARFVHAGTWNPLAYVARKLTQKKTLRVLRSMQPESGGYLEATPLTSFVLMSLSSIGHAQHPVSLSCVQFLLRSQLDDGSWPIDEDLATWVTSLSIGALASDESLDLGKALHESSIDWHLGCQHKVRHPFTGADPGGWGWTDLTGAVPDADDTPAAMLALKKVMNRGACTSKQASEIPRATAAGGAWLLGLQNRDGGWPTFCRGWGKLPFDRSGNDLTAHAIRALHAWQIKNSASAIEHGFRYLAKKQAPDGSWLPLWFGNHDCPDDENKVYGTARVLLAYEELDRSGTQAAQRGYEYLTSVQNADGGWGGGPSMTKWLCQQGLPDQHETTGNPITSSVEETAVVIDALAGSGLEGARGSIIRGVRFLCDAIESGQAKCPWPIGFYFAKLWYHEELYPLIFATTALGKAQHFLNASNN